MKQKILITGLLMTLLFITGCSAEAPGTATPESFSQPQQDESIGYPVSDIILEEESGYPIREYVSEYPEGPEFNIDTPVTQNDLTITGNGPANVPIILIDVSEVGLVLAETVIDNEGSFIFSLERPIPSGNTIGIQLGDIEGTEFDENQFINSETYYDRPFIGILFDLVVVE